MKYEIGSYLEYLASSTRYWEDTQKLRTDLANDPAFVREIIKQCGPSIIPKPPFSHNRDVMGFVDGLHGLEPDEDVSQLPWIKVGWNQLLFEQATVFRQVVDWYIEMIRKGGLLLPAIVYSHPENPKAVIVKNGTHRLIAVNTVINNCNLNYPLPIADKTNVIVCQTDRIPASCSRLSTMKEIQLV